MNQMMLRIRNTISHTTTWIVMAIPSPTAFIEEQLEAESPLQLALEVNPAATQAAQRMVQPQIVHVIFRQWRISPNLLAGRGEPVRRVT
jgi:hypothetical protein